MSNKKAKYRQILEMLQRHQISSAQAFKYINEIKSDRSKLQKSTDEIAIIGISGQFPGANNLETYWQNLANGKNSISPIPETRWEIDTVYSPETGEKRRDRWGGFLDDIELFDAHFFNISPREAEMMDPQQRLFLQEAWKALEDAGYSQLKLNECKCGVFVGCLGREYSRKLEASRIPPDAYSFTGNESSILPARISYFLNLRGPAIAIDTACSSSLVAIHLAFESLLSGTCELAIAGGVMIYSTPVNHTLLNVIGMLSPDGQCKTFDDRADGLVAGEGVGVLVLKPLSKALKDGDHIYAIIKGSGINQDGKTNGISAPSAESQTQLESEVYEKFKINPEMISFIETHGTGTKLGDPIEISALTDAFNKYTQKKHFCAVGSVKTNIGHTLLAAGVASVIKVLLAFKNKQLPPSINYTKPNRHIDFKNSPFYVNSQLKDWESEIETPRVAAISSFGFSGTNAHLVLEEIPKNKFKISRQLKPYYFVAISAKTIPALMEKYRELLIWLNSSPDESIEDITYTLASRRSHFQVRSALIVKDLKQLIEKIKKIIENGSTDDYYINDLTNLPRKPESILKLLGKKVIEEIQNTQEVTADQYKEKIRSLVDIYIKGWEPDWKSLFKEESHRCISLPTYPFLGEKHGIVKFPPPSITEENSIELDQTKSKNISDLICFYPYWKEELLNSKLIHSKEPENIIIFDIDEELFQHLKQKLLKTKIILVKQGKKFIQKENSIFEIDPGNAEHYIRLLTIIYPNSIETLKIIHMWSLNRIQFTNDKKTLQMQLEKGLYSIFYLSQSLIAQKPRERIDLIYVYSSDTGQFQPVYSAISGFNKTLRLENHKFVFKTVEIKSQTQKAIKDIILKELESKENDAINISYRCGSRQVERFKPFDSNINIQKPLPVNADGAYLITGGAGGLGLIFAQYLAKLGKVNIVLSGRSKLSPEKKAKIDSIKLQGSKIIYIPADISVSSEVLRLIKEIKKRFRNIKGIIHSAGIIHDAFILKKIPTEISEVLAPKVYGTLFLDEITKNENLDFFIVFSSLAAVMGNVGQCDYSYANKFLEGFVEWRHMLKEKNVRSGKTKCIYWPFWQEGGMKISHDLWTNLAEKTGLVPMPIKEGIKALEFSFASELPHCIVTFGYEEKLRQLANRTFNYQLETFADYPSSNNFPNSNNQENIIQPELISTKTESYLKTIFGEILKLSPDKIKVNTRFEEFGIDSIMINMFNSKVEKEIGPIPKTLLFEYQTLRDLNTYFIENHKLQLLKFFNIPSQEQSNKINQKATNWQESKRQHQPELTIASSFRESLPSSNKKINDIAIIGISGKYPQASNLEEFWKNLQCGRDSITEIPIDRWDYREYYDPDPAKGKIYCKWGGFIDNVDKFEPLVFNISPREAASMDPQERLFLETVWATIEDAGYTSQSLKIIDSEQNDKGIGVFAGVTTFTYNLLGNKIDEMVSVPLSWSIANRVSFVFDFHGPSMPIDTACSSSLTAIHLACESLKKGESRLAIAGGVNIYLHPSKYHDMCSIKMLSKTGRCYTFGSSADGFVPGEGVGAVLLKPLVQAIHDNDHIYAVIKGSSINHGGRTNGYTIPNPNAQASLIVDALEVGGIDPRTISYVEAHGTGTALGDPIEITGLTKAYRKYTPDKQFCSIGSAKSNIGHLESAAGIAGITKIILQMKYKQLVPSLHARKLNSNIDFINSPFYVQQKLVDWEQPKINQEGTESLCPRRAALSSFGAGGANAHIILEEYEPETQLNSQESKSHLILLSARNEEKLKLYASRIGEFLKNEGATLPPSCTEGIELTSKITIQLQAIVADVLHIEPDELDEDEEFTTFGFDHVTLAILRQKINEVFHQEIPNSVLLENSTIGKLAKYLTEKERESKNEFNKNKKNTPLLIQDISYTLQIGREPMSRRIATVVNSKNELIEKFFQYSQGKNNIGTFFSGDLKTDKKLVESLFKGKAGEDHLDNLFKEHNLEALAQLWVSGFDINWQLLYPEEKPNRVSLPTYPFQGEVYWHSVSSYKKNEKQKCLTPLIDKINPSLSIGEGIVFQKILTASDSILSDHKISGNRIFPGVGYLEMVSEAFYSLNDNHIFNLQKILWLQPLVINDQPKEIQVEIIEEKECFVFEVKSNQNNSSILHARGQIHPISSTYENKKQQISIEMIKDRCSKSLEGEQLYNWFHQRQMVYGPYFQGVKQLYINKGEALSRLELPSAVELELPDYILHPTLIDGVLQTIVGLYPGFPTKKLETPILPFAVEKVEILNPLKSSGYAYVQENGKNSFNAAFLDENGLVCVKLLGISARELTTKNNPVKPLEKKLDDYYFRPQWKLSPLPKESTNLTYKNVTDKNGNKCILVFYTPQVFEITEELAKKHLKDEVIKIKLGTQFRQSSSKDWEVQVNDPLSISRCISKIKKIDYIYFLGGIIIDTSDVNVMEQLERNLETGVISLLRLIKALNSLGLRRRPLYFKVITNNLYQIIPGESIVPLSGAIPGLIGSAARENPQWKVSIIDISIDKLQANDTSIADQFQLEAIMAEPPTPPGIAIGLRKNRRYIRVLEAVKLPSIEITQSPFKFQGVYLILGGLGGIGLTLSNYLAKTVKARLILVDRNPINVHQKEKISQIRDSGGEVLYLQSEATNLQMMTEVISEAKARFGCINGVIHSALSLKDKRLENMDEETFRSTLAPKVMGSVVLYHVVKDEPLDFMLFFSSAQAFFCAAGQGNYAAACTFKDTYALYLKHHQSFPVKIINWGYWGSIGVVSSNEYNERLAKQGIASITPEEGMEAVNRVLTQPVLQIIPLKAEEPTLKEFGFEPKYYVEFYPTQIPSQLDQVYSMFQEKINEDIFSKDVKSLIKFLEALEKLEDMAQIFLLKSFRKMEVFQKFQESYDKEQLKLQLNIISGYNRLFDVILEIFSRAGYIKIKDNIITTTKNIDGKKLLNNFQNEEEIKTRLIEECPEIEPYIRLLWTCLESFPDILTGKRNHMEVMFPKGSLELVESIYQGNLISDFYNRIVARLIKLYVHFRLEKDPDKKINILEIGSGTGGTSRFVIDAIKEYGEKIQYLYSDISLQFIKQGERVFGNQYPFISFKTLDIEKKPEQQGLKPDSIDVLFGTNVFHATKKISNTLKNVNRLIKANGLFILNEVTQRKNISTLTFGLTEGWWLYEDEENRIMGSPLLNPEKWKHLLESTGFRKVKVIEIPYHGEKELMQNVFIAESPVEIIIDCDKSMEKENKIADLTNPKDMIRQNISTHKAKDLITYDIDKNQSIDSTEHVEEIIAEVLSQVLRLNKSEFDPESSFQEYGVDSLLAVEIIDKINDKIEEDLRVTDLFNFSNIRELSIHIVNTLGKKISILQSKEINRKEIFEPVFSSSPLESIETIPFQWNVEKKDINTSKYKDKFLDIAVIGISGKFAGAENIDEYWNNLISGRDSIRKIPKERWDVENVHQGDIEKTYQWGGFLSSFDQFDPLFFNIPYSEAIMMDPQQRLFLHEAWRALEDAGYPENELKGTKCGVFVGCASGDYYLKLKEEGIEIGEYTLMGMASSMSAARVAYHLNLKGTAVTIDTSCSSSLVSINQACESIRSGNCTMAVAGGVTVFSTSLFHTLANKSGILSPSGKCKTFDDNADGFVPGEGVGVVVLKSLETAIQDRDNIYGIIKGGGVNHDGKTMGITAPSVPSQHSLLCEVYDKYSINPETITYLEAHGTGTKLGDSIEVEALTEAFKKYTDKKQFCSIGSVKTNVGHTLAAAGIAGILKILLAFKHKRITPTINLQTLSKYIKLENSPFFIETKTRDWNGNGKPRRAAVSAFGFNGTNAHIVLEESSFQEKQLLNSSKPYYFIPVSAKTESALMQKYRDLLNWLENNPSEILDNIAYTLFMRRNHFPIRSSLIVKNREDFIQKLIVLCEGGKPESYQKCNLKKNKNVPRFNDHKLKDEKHLKIEGTNLEPEQEYKIKLHQIAYLYINGRNDEIDITTISNEKGLKCVSLPTYPFAKQRYWVSNSKIQEQEMADSKLKEFLQMLERGEITASEANLIWEGK